MNYHSCFDNFYTILCKYKSSVYYLKTENKDFSVPSNNEVDKNMSGKSIRLVLLVLLWRQLNQRRIFRLQCVSRICVTFLFF